MNLEPLQSDRTHALNLSSLDPYCATLIFNEFMGGRMINREEWHEGALKHSALFKEISQNFDCYSYMYKLNGYVVKSLEGEAYYVVKTGADENGNQVSMDIQVLITIISRGLTLKGISPLALVEDRGGISEVTINSLAELNDLQTIIEGCKVKKPMWKAVQATLVDRGVGYINQRNELLLTNSGKVMFKKLYPEAFDD